jgi:tRNA(fMet)-specific endonuclease VapC
MTHLLDSDICVEVLRHRDAPAARRLAQMNPDDIALCTVVVAELLYGARRSAEPEMHLAKVHEFKAPYVCLTFDDAAAEAYGDSRAHLAAAGTPIGPNDLLIAAIARSQQLTLVTHNLAEFSRVPGLSVENGC